jgi:hypothetical protein
VASQAREPPAFVYQSPLLVAKFLLLLDAIISAPVQFSEADPMNGS